MAQPSYGPTVKARVKRLLEALLAYADYDILDSDRLKIQLERRKQKNQLVFRTKVRFLEQLTSLDRHEDPRQLTKSQIKEAIKRLEDFLEILVDNRSATKGSHDWHFTLNLWSPDHSKNLELFDVEWERRRSEKSKQLEASQRKRRAPLDPNTEFLSPPNHQRLFEELLRMDFREHVRLVTKAIYNTPYRIAGFLVHGEPDCGQQCLVNRLFRLTEEWQNNLPIKSDVTHNAAYKSISRLWGQLARRFHLPKNATPSQIRESICDRWQTKNVIFIFDKVDCMPPGMLSAWLQEFWEPLVAIAENMPDRETHLLMFLVDRGGTVCKSNLVLAEQFEHPRTPLRLPPASNFTEDVLSDWITDARGLSDLQIPPGLTAQMLLNKSQGGIPEDVYEAICDHCGVSWEGDLAQWLI